MSEELKLPRMIHSCLKAMEVNRDEFRTCLKAWTSNGMNLPKVETNLFRTLYV